MPLPTRTSTNRTTSLLFGCMADPVMVKVPDTERAMRFCERQSKTVPAACSIS